MSAAKRDLRGRFASHKDPHQVLRERFAVLFGDPQEELRKRLGAPTSLAKYDPSQKRDQRGRWSTGGGSIGEQTVDAPMVDAVKPTGNRKIEDVTMHGTGDGQMWMAHTKDGKQVHLRPSTLGYSNPKPPTPEMARSILNGVADAYEADPSPNGPPEVVYHSVEGYGRLLAARGDADTEGGFSRAQKVRASVFSNVPGRINVITDVLAEPYSNNTGPQASITFSKDRVAMTMLHEYGHLRFFEGLTKDRLAKTTAVFKNPKVKATLSNYGLRNHLEAEADSYAEWHVTGGHTNNLAAQAYGEVLGWKKT